MQEKKRAVLFVNGVLCQTGWLHGYIQPTDYLVAVDGGYHHMQRTGLQPHLLVGDLDSLEPGEVAALDASGVEIARYAPEKDQTDLELALEIVSQRGYQMIRVVGGFGGRLDQTLANIFLLDHPSLAGLDARFENGTEEAFLIRERGTVHGAGGDIVSLLPFGSPAEGVTTRGLAYPLLAETLWPHHSRGISNVMLDTGAEVTVDSGLLLCIHMRQPALSENAAGSNLP